MLVKDLIEKLKNLPEDAEVTINCFYSNDKVWNVPCTGDVAEVLFDKDSKTVDLLAKE